MENRIICTCFDISVEDIQKAINEGHKTYEEISDATGLGTACGVCEDEAREVIAELLGE